MAYGVLYRCNWIDLLGVTKRVDILEKDYSDTITVVRGGPEPVVFRWSPDSFINPVLKPSSADIHLMSPSRLYFKSLFTSNKFKYKVQYYESSVIKWTGYLMPDLYSEPYENKNYPIILKAVDGLGYLKNIDFLDSDGNEYEGRDTDMNIIAICMKKLNMGLLVNVAINIFETRMDKGSNDNPLQQAFTYRDIFKDKDCAYVLREIIKPYGCMMYQMDNTWWIVRKPMLNAETLPYLSYDISGVFISFEGADSINHNKALTNTAAADADRNVLVMGRTTIEVIPAIKELLIHHDYGLKPNILEGGDLKADDFTWDETDEIYRSNDFEDKNGAKGAPGEYFENSTEQMVMVLSAPPNDDIPSPSGVYWKYKEPISLTASNVQKFIIEFEFKIRSNPYDNTTYNYPVKVYAYLQLGPFYIFNQTGWRTMLGYLPPEDEGLYLYLGSYESNGPWINVSFEGNGIPTTDDLYVRLMQARGKDDDHPFVEFEILYKKVSIRITGGEIPVSTDINLTTVVDENNNYIPDPIEIVTSDPPDIENNTAIYLGGKTLLNGSATKLWQVTGSQYQESLIISLARMITDQFGDPMIKYDGTIEDSRIKIGSLVADNWEHFYMMVQEISAYYTMTNEMNIQLIQMVGRITGQIIYYPQKGRIAYPGKGTIIYPKRN